MISEDIHGNVYKVATKDLTWRPSAYAIVLHEGRILLTVEEGKYHLPGGGIELNETPEEAVIRELREETGIIISNPKLIDINSSYFTWENLDQPGTFSHIKSLLLYYACSFNGGTFEDAMIDEYEKASGLRAEWVNLTRIDDIIIGTTVDWRDIVKGVIGSKLVH